MDDFMNNLVYSIFPLSISVILLYHILCGIRFRRRALLQPNQGWTAMTFAALESPINTLIGGFIFMVLIDREIDGIFSPFMILHVGPLFATTVGLLILSIKAPYFNLSLLLAAVRTGCACASLSALYRLQPELGLVLALVTLMATLATAVNLAYISRDSVKITEKYIG